jgi:hypothetical protein
MLSVNKKKISLSLLVKEPKKYSKKLELYVRTLNRQRS